MPSATASADPVDRHQAQTRRLCVDLAAVLRRNGVPVGPAQVTEFYEALHSLGDLSTLTVFLVGRMTLAPDVTLRAAYARSFAEYFFADLAENLPVADTPPAPPAIAIPDEGAQPPADMRTDEQDLDLPPQARVVASDTERLMEKSFAKMTDDEHREAARVVHRLRLRLDTRLSRRRFAADRGDALDMRRTFRRSLATDGEPITPASRARRRVERPVTVVLDVSGSMAAYATPMLRFAHGLVQASRSAEVYTVGVRLHRITEALRIASTDRALARVTAAVTDWDGGTRLASSLTALIDERGGHSALRGAVLVVFSDGLDRDDPAELSRAMARLAGLAHRIIWLNPLKGDPRYQPIARGMAAALPYVDDFLSGHNLASLTDTAHAIAGARGADRIQPPRRKRA